MQKEIGNDEIRTEVKCSIHKFGAIEHGLLGITFDKITTFSPLGPGKTFIGNKGCSGVL